MSNALATASLMDAIRLAILAAWGSIPISYGPPRVPLAAPYSVLEWEPVAVSYDGYGGSLSNPSQLNTFTILGRFPFPSDPTHILSIQKVTKANTLISQLQSGPTFGTVGLIPLVTKVEPTERDDPNEKVYELRLTFTVVTIASHS